MGDYRAHVERYIRESSGLDFRFTLVTQGLRRQDPFVLAQLAMNVDPAFSPIIAVNPAYSSPVSVAKQLTTIGTLYQRRVACNIVPGSFLKELREVNDGLDSEGRNERLREFAEALAALTSGTGPVSI